jgi:hypothetical protein
MRNFLIAALMLCSGSAQADSLSEMQAASVLGAYTGCVLALSKVAPQIAPKGVSVEEISNAIDSRCTEIAMRFASESMDAETTAALIKVLIDVRTKSLGGLIQKLVTEAYNDRKKK